MAIQLSSEVILGRSGNTQLLIVLASVPLCDGLQQGMLSICCYHSFVLGILKFDVRTFWFQLFSTEYRIGSSLTKAF